VGDDPAAARRHIPRSVYFNTRSGRIEIGRQTVFGEHVMVLTGKHASIKDARNLGVPLHHVPEGGRDIIIGNGCYIGSGAILIGPLKVGDHAVIGAGAVVTRDVPAESFVGGNPARVISMLHRAGEAQGTK
jgi:acetyltransferase-like isoleucine patch superfamily enzyme